jgi:hypothetical protein
MPRPVKRYWSAATHRNQLKISGCPAHERLIQHISFDATLLFIGIRKWSVIENGDYSL